MIARCAICDKSFITIDCGEDIIISVTVCLRCEPKRVSNRAIYSYRRYNQYNVAILDRPYIGVSRAIAYKKGYK